MAAEVNILIKATDQASGVLSKVAGGLSSIAKMAATVGVAAAAGFVVLGKQALDATAEYERMSLTMESLVARELRAKDSTLSMADALKLAGDESKRLLGWIQDVAIHSPFDMLSVQTAYRQALTYGFASDEAQKLTQNMVDFAAANGLTAEAMNTVSYALGQIHNNDKVLMLDLRQLMQVGVPVLDILKEMGMTFEDVSDGAVKSADFIAKFNEVMLRDFGGAAERQTASWTGLINTLGDLKKMGLRELFAGIFGELQPLVAKFAEWFQGDGLEMMKEWGIGLGELTKKILGIPEALAGMSADDLLQKAGEGFMNFGLFINEKIKSIDWQALSDSIAEGINSIDWATLTQNILMGIGAIIDAVATAFERIDWSVIFSSIGAAIQEVTDAIFAPLMGKVIEFVNGLAVDLETAKVTIITALEGIKTTIREKLAEAAQAFTNFKQTALGQFITGFISLPVMVMTSLMTLLTVIRSVLTNIKNEMVKQGKEMMQGLLDGLNKGIPKILAAIRRLVSAIMTILGNAGLNIPITVGGSSGGTGGSSASLGSGSGGGPKPRGRAAGSGGWQVVPPGYTNDAYTIAMRSGERYNVIANGERGGGSGTGMTINLNLSSFLSLSDMDSAQAKLQPIIERAIRNAQGVA